MRQIRIAVGTVAAVVALFAYPFVGSAAPSLVRLSTDPFHNPTSQHQTEVEPDIVSWGSTLVSAFQVGRIAPGGAADIGWATSTDAGGHWSHGFLPGLTIFKRSGAAAGASDPAVAYDAKHRRWLIVSLTINSNSLTGVKVSSSQDGLSWARPVVVARPGSLDKSWISCDDSSASQFFGHCYAEWDVAGPDVVQMSTSSDGGQTWSKPIQPPGAFGLAAEAVVRPDGAVIVPFLADAGSIEAFKSTDGGRSWTAPVVIASARIHVPPGGFRGGPLPSAAVDRAGRVFVTWETCIEETGCSTNDAVLTTSTNGTAWSAPARVPIDAPGAVADVEIPGLGVDRSTQGSSAHLGIVFYEFSNVGCAITTCRLNVGFISSPDGGATWSAPMTLAGPMLLTWLANSQNGRMVGDYFATAFAGGRAFPIFAVGHKPPAGSAFDEAMYTVNGGLAEK
jgi:hypothetical protein